MPKKTKTAAPDAKLPFGLTGGELYVFAHRGRLTLGRFEGYLQAAEGGGLRMWDLLAGTAVFADRAEVAGSLRTAASFLLDAQANEAELRKARARLRKFDAPPRTPARRGKPR